MQFVVVGCENIAQQGYYNWIGVSLNTTLAEMAKNNESTVRYGTEYGLKTLS
jgi:hypothetical protein